MDLYVCFRAFNGGFEDAKAFFYDNHAFGATRDFEVVSETEHSVIWRVTRCSAMGGDKETMLLSLADADGYTDVGAVSDNRHFIKILAELL